MKHLARLFALLLLVAAGLSQARNLQPTDDPEASPVWQKVRASIFEGRSIAPAPADIHGRPGGAA